MRHQGTLVKWVDSRGFGFIAPHEDGADVFVQVKAFTNHSRRPEINEVVSYELISDSELVLNIVYFLTRTKEAI